MSVRIIFELDGDSKKDRKKEKRITRAIIADDVPQMIQYVQKYGEINMYLPWAGGSLVQVCIMHKAEDCLKYLLQQKGIDLDQTSGSGLDALEFAEEFGKWAVPLIKAASGYYSGDSEEEEELEEESEEE